MTHFPQPHPQHRATRIQLGNTVPALVMREDGLRAKARIQIVSVTGGLLQLASALEEGDFVEVAFRTQSGPVHGMAEMLHPKQTSTHAILQPFRFVALGDDDHRKLRMALESLFDRKFIDSISEASEPSTGI